MKITKEQREAIIKEAITTLKKNKWGICWAMTNTLYPNNHRMHPLPYHIIRKTFPCFKREIAVKYFNASEMGIWWWSYKDTKNRLNFLNYLLTGKLPKKGKRK